MGVNYGPVAVRPENTTMVLDAKSPKSYSGSGTVWRDSSGKGNHATINSTGVTYNSNGYFTCDGSTGYVNTSINLTETMSFTLWYRRLKSDINGANRIMGAAAHNSGAPWFELNISDPYYGSGGTIELWAYSWLSAREDWALYTPSIYNQWRNLTVVFNAGTGYAYVDGALVGSDTYAYVPWSTAATLVPITLGRARGYEFNSGTYYYTNCDLAYFATYNCALTAAEAKLLYDTCRLRFWV